MSWPAGTGPGLYKQIVVGRDPWLVIYDALDDQQMTSKYLTTNLEVDCRLLKRRPEQEQLLCPALPRKVGRVESLDTSWGLY